MSKTSPPFQSPEVRSRRARNQKRNPDGTFAYSGGTLRPAEQPLQVTPSIDNLLGMATGDDATSRRLRSQLQSESPDGLAHSALSAIRRGDTPTPEAQASLDATLKWRDAWEQWHTNSMPYQSLRSNLEHYENTLDNAKTVAAVADHVCSDMYEINLRHPSVANQQITPTQAEKNLRTVHAEHYVPGQGGYDWNQKLRSYASDLRGWANRQDFDRKDQIWDSYASADGLLFADMVDPDRETPPPVEPTIALWSQHCSDSPELRQAGLDYIVASAQNAIAEAHKLAEETAHKQAEALADVDVVAKVGGLASIADMLDAADEAKASGVRLQPHQQAQIAVWSNVYEQKNGERLNKPAFRQPVC